MSNSTIYIRHLLRSFEPPEALVIEQAAIRLEALRPLAAGSALAGIAFSVVYVLVMVAA